MTEQVPTAPNPDCRNCAGVGCMDCRTRTVHDECVNDCPMCCPALPVTSAATLAPVPLFARAAQRPRDPMDFSYRSLGEVFADLLYQVSNGEDIRRRLADFAKTTANDPVPRSIADNIDEEEDDLAGAVPGTYMEQSICRHCGDDIDLVDGEWLSDADDVCGTDDLWRSHQPALTESAAAAPALPATAFRAAFDEPGYIVGRIFVSTEDHGDRSFESWDDAVHRSASAAAEHIDQHVDDGPDHDWEVFEVRRAAAGSSKVAP